MKRLILLTLLLLLACGPVQADTPDEGAATVARLYDLMAAQAAAENDPSLMAGITREVCWRVGGDTQALLHDQQWDVAQVRASEVDLQRLYEAGVLAAASPALSRSDDNWYLLAPEYRAMVPLDQRPLGYERPVALVAYREGEDVILLLVRDRPVTDKRRMLADDYSSAFMAFRTREQAASVEVITRLIFPTQDQLAAGEWDVALIDTAQCDLSALDALGLLADLREHPRLNTTCGLLTDAARARYTAADGRMLALPYWDGWAGWIVNPHTQRRREALDALARSEDCFGLSEDKGALRLYHDIPISQYVAIGGHDADMVEIPYQPGALDQLRQGKGKRMLFDHAKDARLAAYVAQLPPELRSAVTTRQGKILAIPCYDPYGEVALIMRNRDQPAHAEDQPVLDYMAAYLQTFGIWAE